MAAAIVHVILSFTLTQKPRLWRRFHLDAVRVVLGDSSGLFMIVHNNQPRTMWTQMAALGAQISKACPMYSHMRTYSAHRKKVGQNTAVLWPTPYSSLSSSEETSLASSWMAWSTLVRDMAFPLTDGVSAPLFSRRSHLLGWWITHAPASLLWWWGQKW